MEELAAIVVTFSFAAADPLQNERYWDQRTTSYRDGRLRDLGAGGSGDSSVSVGGSLVKVKIQTSIVKI